MLRSNYFSAKFLLLMLASSLAFIFVFIPNQCQAEIYKWRDARGVTQYADSLPADTSARSTHNEIINDLQAAKNNDFCILPTAKKLIQLEHADFLSANIASKHDSTSKPLRFNQYLPLNTTSLFNVGGKTITAFANPIKTAQIPALPILSAPLTSAPNAVSASAAAPVGHIFYIALNGNNNNPGTQALPWRNLNHAVYAMRAGDTVLVKNGTYAESLYINRSGAAGKPITYKAYPGHTPKIEINKKDLEGILIQGASYIHVEGFEVIYTAPGAEAAKGEQVDNGIDISNAGQTLPHHIMIKNNKVHGFPGGGIFTVLADYVTFEGNTVWQNALWAKWGNSGISMYQNVNVDEKQGYHMVIRGNTVYKNENKLPSYAIGSTTITDGNCIIIDDLRHTQKFLENKTNYAAYKSKTLIENNICYDNGARGIHVYSSDNVLVRHNTLYKNQRTASINDGELSAYDAKNIRFVNNIVYAIPGKKANGTGNVSNVIFERNLYFGTTSIPNKAANDIIADPLFVRPSLDATIANFKLRAGSPAIDTALANKSPAIDISGAPRSAKPDIGAWEFR